MFGHYVFKSKPGKCLFINLSKDKVEIVKRAWPPKGFVVTSDKVFKVTEYGQMGRVFVVIEGEIKPICD